MPILFALNPLSPTSLLGAFGVLAVLFTLFAETGLLVGFFLPGDSLLFTAGLLCAAPSGSRLHLSLPLVLLAAATGALSGAQVGYLIGRRAGRPLLRRVRRRALVTAITRTESLLSRYGYGKTIVLARFIPIVRTVMNPLAGALDVPARTFVTWQVVGGLLWSVGVTVAGYLLGSSIPGVDRYLLPLIGIVIVLSLVPMAVGIIRARLRRH